MESYINVIGNGQKIEVAAESTGVINEETLRRAFLLEKDVIIGLFRNGRALRFDGSVFYLQDHWVGAEFQLNWKEAHRSRPATPMGQALDERPISPYCPASLRSNSPDWQSSVISFLLETEQGCCVTVFAKRAALTCAHCLDDSITIGSYIAVKPCRGNKISTFPNGQNSTILKVAYINKKVDFVLLLSKIDLCDEPPLPIDAVFGETYVLLGLSAMDREYTKLENLKIKMVNGPLCVKRGVVSSKIVDKYNKHMGDSGMKEGDSGGGLYTLYGHFIGIAVEFDSKKNNGISMCHFNPATMMLVIIQEHGYSLFYLNNFEANTYPEKEDSNWAEYRDH